MIGLNKKRTQASEEFSNTLVLVIETLLHAVEVHSVPGDRADREKFQADIRSLGEALVQPSAAAMLAAAGSVENVIAEYNQRAARFLRMHTAETQKAVTKLIDVLAAISSGQESSIARLRELEHSLAKAPSMREITTFGAQLAENLEGIRADAVRWRERTEQALSELRRKVESGANGESPENQGPGSRASGLMPTRAKTEVILDRILHEGGHGYVVAFVVNRVQLINARFGYTVGDDILALVQEHLEQNLKPGDQMFRWSGPVFLVTMNRPVIERVRGEVNRLTSAKLETTVNLDSRSVLLPVTCTSAIFSLFETPSAAVLIQQIDAFAAGGTRG